MAKKIIKAQMKQRRDTLENWAAANPVLLDGELGFIEGFNDRFKVGDGKTAWNDLSYFSGSFNPSGTYPDLTAGDLAGRGESVPAEFGFRASGGKSIKDGRAYIKRIKGNSVVWNQKLNHYVPQDCELTEDGNLLNISPTNTFAGIKSVESLPIVVGHKFICIAYRMGEGRVLVNLGGYDSSTNVPFVITNESRRVISVYDYNQTETFTITRPIVIDLTQMFGAGNEPSTIEEFNARVATLGIDMYAYNEGEVIHCNTESIKSIGDNAFDNSRNSFKEYNLTTDGDFSLMNTQDLYVGVTKNGYSDKYAITQYAKTDNGYSFVNTRGGYGIGAMVKALPNEDYHIERTSEKGGIGIGFYDSDKHMISFIYNLDSPTFTTPNNCAYILLILTAQDAYIGQEITISNIMLTLVHSGWKQDTDAGYQPYWQDTLPLPIISKYFPQGMKSAGSAHDEIRYNKATQKWEAVQRVTSLDLGTLDWSSVTSGHFCVQNVLGDIGYGNLICAKYSTGMGRFSDMAADKVIGNNPESPYNNAIFVRDDAYTDVESFKAMLQEKQVELYYELAGPIVTEIAEDFRDYYQVADFGTEQSQSNVPSAAFSADIIYQFNAVDMIREHEAEINELQSIIATMQAQLTSLINK